jgi:hypothetical protein
MAGVQLSEVHSCARKPSAHFTGRRIASGILAALLSKRRSDTTAHAACNLIPGNDEDVQSPPWATTEPALCRGRGSHRVGLRPCDTASPGALLQMLRIMSSPFLFKPPDGPHHRGQRGHRQPDGPRGGATGRARQRSEKRDVCVSRSTRRRTPGALGPRHPRVCDETGACKPVPHLSFRFPTPTGYCCRRATGAGSLALRRSRSRGGGIPFHARSRRHRGATGRTHACIDDFSTSRTRHARRLRPRARAGVPTRTSLISLRSHRPTTTRRSARRPVRPARAVRTSFASPWTRPGTSLHRWIGGDSRAPGALPFPRLLRAIFLPPAPAIQLPLGAGPSRTRTRPRAVFCRPSSSPDRMRPPMCSRSLGSSDAPYTILRIARRFGRCANGPNDGQACTSFADCPGGTCLDACVGGSDAGNAATPRCPDAPSSCPDGRAARSSICRRAPALRWRYRERSAGRERRGPVPADVEQLRPRAQVPVPLEGLVQTSRLFSFVLSEQVAGSDLNGDGDTGDSVVTLRDRDTGEAQPIGAGRPAGSKVLRTAARWCGSSSRRSANPAVAVEGDAIAFLEPETGRTTR